jgi:hypothetical protein
MNVNWANHIEEIRKIEPQQLIDYLEKHEWIEQNFWVAHPRPVKIYQKIVEGGLYQVTVPMSRELVDYISAMLNAVIEIINSNETREIHKLTAKLTKTEGTNK